MTTLLSLDTETHLIRPGNLTPKLVCVQIGHPDKTALYNAEDGTDEVEFALTYPGHLLVGHNISYDLAVLVNHRPHLRPIVFNAIDKGFIRDTEVREKLLNIKDGTLKIEEDGEGNPVKVHYALLDLSLKYLAVKLDKGEFGTDKNVDWDKIPLEKQPWRVKYHTLDGIPLYEWPMGARRYALMDAAITRDVYLKQETRAGGAVVDEIPQIRAAFSLHLMSVRGMTTDGEYTETLKENLEEGYASIRYGLCDAGLVRRPRPFKSGPRKGLLTEPSTDTKALRYLVKDVYSKRGIPYPKTETGLVSTSRDTLEASGNPHLKAYADYKATEKILKTYIPVLAQGAVHAINCRYNILVASGRTSCYSPNLQNIPRDGGVRDAFVPRPGYVYAICDYSAIELRALGQICLWLFGESKLAEAFCAGRDPHLEMAAELLNIPYEEAFKRKHEDEVKTARQGAKAVNFGYPGGLGVKKFIEYARKTYKLLLTEQEASDRKDAWFRRWPEMREYFKWINELVEGQRESARVEQFVSGRIRGGLSFCNAANTPFQGLPADGIKAALWEITKACYLDETSPLFGSYPVAMIHDEIIIESPVGKAAEAAEELSRLMKLCMSWYISDLPIETTICLAERWYKKAEETRDSAGKLIPWRPKNDGAKQARTGRVEATGGAGPNSGQGGSSNSSRNAA
jgi:hypothetical protein